MENKASRNSIILKNLNSPYFEQAIFIMKRSGDEMVYCDDIVSEAQRIVDSFIKQRARKKLRTRRFRAALFALPVCFAAAAAVFVILQFFNP